MARARTRRKKKKTASKNRSRFSRIDFKKIVYTLCLLSFLVFSIGILTYVIFFRMVVAAELELAPNPPISREEGDRVEQVNLPECAIIIDDMGYHHEIGKKMIDLPLNLSFSFLPHAPYTSELENMAFRLGRTILLHLPLQPKDSTWDPGPGALYVDEQAQQESLFQQNLTMVPHAVGVNNHMGSFYSEDKTAMTSLLELIDARRLFYVDSYTTPNSLGYTLAQQKEIRSARRQIFLDNVEEVEAICERLSELMRIALQHGQAIGIAHPHKETLTALQSCIDSKRSPVKFVGVEKLVD